MIESITQTLNQTNSIPETDELPIGFTMALAQNLKAMQVFTSMPEAEKKSIIARAEAAGSKAEMQNLVDSLYSSPSIIG